MKSRELTHDFLKWLIENYDVRLSMTKKDADWFERLYPDLTAQLEKEDNETTYNSAQGFTNEPWKTCGAG